MAKKRAVLTKPFTDYAGTDGVGLAGWDPGKPEDERKKWAQYSSTLEAALTFWSTFLDLRRGGSKGPPLGAAALARVATMLRAMSWVESFHGTGVGQQPARDPMQCGNPADAWWRELRSGPGKGSRFVRGPKFPNKNLSAGDLAEAVAKEPAFPAAARHSSLANAADGHRDLAFGAVMSHFWATPLFLHRLNTKAEPQRPAYDCGQLTERDLLDGAYHYNGKGDAAYLDKVKATLKMLGGLPALDTPLLFAEDATAAVQHVAASGAPPIDILVDLIPRGSSNRPGTKLKTPLFITVHNTSNASDGADALMHAKYVKGPDARKRGVSWHFTIDERYCVQHLPIDEVGWHAGGANAVSVAIEVCQHAGADRMVMVERAALLTAMLMPRLGVTVDRVRTHQSWTGKDCPKVILNEYPGGFAAFLALVSSYEASLAHTDSVAQSHEELTSALILDAATSIGTEDGALSDEVGDRVMIEQLLGRQALRIAQLERQLLVIQTELREMS